MANRPITTLFMLMSVDGKISTGNTDRLDFDQDLPNINYVKNGLQQYYDFEKETDWWSLCTGKVQAKIGVNTANYTPVKIDVKFAIVDNNHLTASGVKFLAHKTRKLVIITSNKKHPAYSTDMTNVSIIEYSGNANFTSIFQKLKDDYKCNRLTIQSGATLNGHFLREKLIDYLNIVVAPILIGGRDVPTLIDGEAISSVSQLSLLSPMRLLEAKTLKNSYLQLRYKIL